MNHDSFMKIFIYEHTNSIHGEYTIVRCAYVTLLTISII